MSPRGAARCGAGLGPPEAGGSAPAGRSVGGSVGARASPAAAGSHHVAAAAAGAAPGPAASGSLTVRPAPGHGTARPGPAGRRSRREPAAAAAAPLSHGGAHAQRRGGAPAASKPFPRRCPRMKRRRAPAGRGCASRRRRGTGAGLELGAASQTKIAGEGEEEEEEEEEKRDRKYTESGEGERENSSPFPSPTGKTGGNAPAPKHCWRPQAHRKNVPAPSETSAETEADAGLQNQTQHSGRVNTSSTNSQNCLRLVPAPKHPSAEPESWKTPINPSRASHIRQLHAGVNLGRICLSLKFFITPIRQKCYLLAKGRVTFPVGTKVFLSLLL
ncbi:skin secretory protein xP2-like [Falco naumanni]|uniref:skin secretory protein xP2-like n=1 Tax=Falco naumanni TaxID=148594 RepID=UPI001ADE6C10|nr:skin secretory protein xP2-like [Falco naumanni]